MAHFYTNKIERFMKMMTMTLVRLQGHQISTTTLCDVGKNFGRSLLYLDPNQSDRNDGEEDLQAPKFECKASVEKDESMKITRFSVILTSYLGSLLYSPCTQVQCNPHYVPRFSLILTSYLVSLLYSLCTQVQSYTHFLPRFIVTLPMYLGSL